MSEELLQAPPGAQSKVNVPAVMMALAQELPPASPKAAEIPAQKPAFENIDPAPAAQQAHDIALLENVNVRVQVLLGRARLTVEEILRLGQGSVVELDRLAGEPLDILVNDKLVAHGEVLVLNGNFCVRVTDIVEQEAPK
ncbi:MAG: flagellar motor switch protein FliN [Planctomycetaceae bacterium]|nr:flagellar motor switch protein FliN [Planctomycetota bacterium]NUO16063.1 flagellar motor switch protein FliN [Planctomycetaceae bacterium]GIK51710.1 MAG: hypothetical protein BroJett014_06830 [Planctomycetota bacterium]